MRTEQKYGTTYRYPESIEELKGRIISYSYRIDDKWQDVYYQIYAVSKVAGGYLLCGEIMDTYDDLIVDDWDNMPAPDFAFIPEESMGDLLNLKSAKGKRYYSDYPIPETDTYWKLFFGNTEEFISLYEED